MIRFMLPPSLRSEAAQQHVDMRLDQAMEIVRNRVELRECGSPEHGDQKRSYAKSRNMVGLERAEFAARNSACNDGCQKPEAAIDDFATVKFGERGKIARFGEEYLGQNDAIAFADEGADAAQNHAQQIGRRTVEAFGGSRHGPDRGADRFGDKAAEHGLLGFEIE